MLITGTAAKGAFSVEECGAIAAGGPASGRSDRREKRLSDYVEWIE